MVTKKVYSNNLTSFLLQPSFSFLEPLKSTVALSSIIVLLILNALLVQVDSKMVVPFLGVELFLLGLFMLWLQKQSEAREIIHFHPRLIRVKKRQNDCVRAWDFDPSCTSLLVCHDETRSMHHLTLCGNSGLVELGDFLTEKDLKSLLGYFERFNVREQKGQQWGTLRV